MIAPTGTFVAVVDKAHADRVVWKTLPEAGGYLPERWRPIVERFADAEMAGQVAVLNYARFAADGADAAIAGLKWGQEHEAEVRACWQLLAAAATEADYDLALRTVERNADPAARRAAILVLGNFLARDGAWWALVDALRDPDERTRNDASQVLFGAVATAGRAVDWRPVAGSIAHLLDGTSIGNLTTVARILVATEVDPALAPLLAANGAPALLQFAAAEAKFARDPARALLTRLVGQDHGGDVAAWRAALAAKAGG